MDLSKLSTDELKSLKAGDLSKLSTESLSYIKSSGVSSQTQPTKEDSLSMVKRVGSDIQNDISKRPNYIEQIASNTLPIRQDMNLKNVAKFGLGMAQTTGIPITAISAGIANPALQMQQGNFNPRQLAEEAYKGFTLQKQGRVGDVYRGAGMEKNTAGLLGFGVEMLAPYAALSRVNKLFGKLTTSADLKLEGAGQDILKAGKAAEDIAGKKLTEIFSKVDSVPADATKALDYLKRLPKAIVDRIDEEVPQLAKTGQFTVASLRKVKQLVGKYSPGKFNKGAPEENLSVEDYKEAYGKLADLLHETVSSVSSKKETARLIAAENTFSKIIKSSGYLKNKIVDRYTGLASRTGELAQKVKNPLVSTPRIALDTLKTAGGDNRALIGGAEASMNSFNRWLMLKGLTQHAGNAALFGGAIGGIGGYVGGKLYKKNGQE